MFAGELKVVHVHGHNWLKGSPYYTIDMEFRELTLADYIRSNRNLVQKNLQYSAFGV